MRLLRFCISFFHCWLWPL